MKKVTYVACVLNQNLCFKVLKAAHYRVWLDN